MHNARRKKTKNDLNETLSGEDSNIADYVSLLDVELETLLRVSVTIFKNQWKSSADFKISFDFFLRFSKSQSARDLLGSAASLLRSFYQTNYAECHCSCFFAAAILRRFVNDRTRPFPPRIFISHFIKISNERTLESQSPLR